LNTLNQIEKSQAVLKRSDKFPRTFKGEADHAPSPLHQELNYSNHVCSSQAVWSEATRLTMALAASPTLRGELPVQAAEDLDRAINSSGLERSDKN